MSKTLTLLIALMLALPAQATETQLRGLDDPKPVRLLKTGHLPRDHWYSLKLGRPYWLYEMDNGANKVEYEEIVGVPDTRDFSERSAPNRFLTRGGEWLVPALIAVGVALLGAGR